MNESTRTEAALPDYGEYSGIGSDAKGVANVGAMLNRLADEARTYQAEIDEATEALKLAKSKLQSVVEDALPKAMRQAGLTEFRCADGMIVRLKEQLLNSIPVARRQEAWDWLETNGFADILKREVTVAFALTEGDAAKALAARLADEYNRSVAMERWAEPATVKSLLRRLIDEKKSIPRDLFGVKEFDVAEFKAAKS